MHGLSRLPRSEPTPGRHSAADEAQWVSCGIHCELVSMLLTQVEDVKSHTEQRLSHSFFLFVELHFILRNFKMQ